MANNLTVRHLKEDEERLRERYFIFREPPIKYMEEGWLFPGSYKNFADRLYNFKLKPTDVFVITFPKSGTTWMQEIVWSLLHNPDLDNPRGNIIIEERSPTIEADMFLKLPGLPSPEQNPTEVLEKLPSEERFLDETFLAWSKTLESPRVLKSHCPFALLPPKLLQNCKVIYVARDPRDVIFSYYYFSRLQKCFHYIGTLDEYVDDFLNDKVVYAPYWSHLKQAWEKKNLPNFCFVFYEDFKNDLTSGVKKIDKFLGTNRSDDQIHNVVQHTTFDQMKKNAKENEPTSFNFQYFNKAIFEEGGGFFRKGEAGDWKKRFTPQQMEKINKWMAKNLPAFGNNFPYKI